MMEEKFLSLVERMTEEEQQEMLKFIEYLLKCQEEGHVVTSEEAYEMGREARKRLRK